MAKDKLVVRPDVSEYIILSEQAVSISELFQENMGAEEQITPFDLPRAKNPSGGSLKWEISGGGEEPESISSVEGVLIYHKNNRAYWKGEYSGSVPPDCVSPDGKTGIGTPGVVCAKCPYSRFGSGKNSSQACKMMKHLFMLRPNSILPTLFIVPPTSLKRVRPFLIDLVNRRKQYWKIITNIRLSKATSKSGQDFAEFLFSIGGDLDEENVKVIEPYRNSLIDSLASMPIVFDEASLNQEAGEGGAPW